MLLTPKWAGEFLKTAPVVLGKENSEALLSMDLNGTWTPSLPTRKENEAF